MPSFAIQDDQFVLDGNPFRLLAGAMHYFRVPRQLWEDRLRKLRAMGLNTVETYVAWNLHEPQPGRFRFSGELDLSAYLRAAADASRTTCINLGIINSRCSRASRMASRGSL